MSRSARGDRRLQDLLRSLQASPNDVQVQHAAMTALVRTGKLPPEALHYVFPGRPIRPWQFNPLSYLLLEAERLGRETEWRRGLVEFEWAEDPIPAFGAERFATGGFPVLGVGRPRAPRWPSSSSYPAARFGRAFVGFRPLDFYQGRALNQSRVSPPRGSPYSSEENRQQWIRYISSSVPKHVPALDHHTAFKIKHTKAGLPGEPEDVMHSYPPEPGAHPGGLADSREYQGSLPDLYEPLLVLYAAPPRVVSRGSGEDRWRGLQRGGPLLDVRLVRRARIMDRQGGRWV